MSDSLGVTLVTAVILDTVGPMGQFPQNSTAKTTEQAKPVAKELPSCPFCNDENDAPPADASRR